MVFDVDVDVDVDVDADATDDVCRSGEIPIWLEI